MGRAGLYKDKVCEYQINQGVICESVFYGDVVQRDEALYFVMFGPLKKNNVEISVPEVVQPPPPLWKDVAGEPILLPSLGGSRHYFWGVRI